MSSVQWKNIGMEFVCSLNTYAKKKKKKDVLVGKAFHHLLMGAPDYEQAFMSVAPPVGHGPREGVRVRWPWASMSH